jgi:hypothetical protein
VHVRRAVLRLARVRALAGHAVVLRPRRRTLLDEWGLLRADDVLERSVRMPFIGRIVHRVVGLLWRPGLHRWNLPEQLRPARRLLHVLLSVLQ